MHRHPPTQNQLWSTPSTDYVATSTPATIWDGHALQMVAGAAASMDTAVAVPAIALQPYASPLSDCVVLRQQAHTSTKPRTLIPRLEYPPGLYLQQLLQPPSDVEA